MTIHRTNVVLAVLLFLVVVMTIMTRVDYSRPNVEVLPHFMKYTPAYHSYDVNPNFKDNPHYENDRTLQPPVEGTIARGELPLYYQPTPEDALRAGQELVNPYEFDAIEPSTTPTPPDADEGEMTADAAPSRDATGEDSQGAEAVTGDEPPSDDVPPDPVAEARARWGASVERGGIQFRVFCLPCHGTDGAGNGPVAQRGFPPPPSFLTGNSRQMKDGQLFHILTYGQGNMTPFAAQLSRATRWDIINYVRDLQRQAPDANLPAAEAGADAAPADTVTKPETNGESDAD